MESNRRGSSLRHMHLNARKQLHLSQMTSCTYKRSITSAAHYSDGHFSILSTLCQYPPPFPHITFFLSMEFLYSMHCAHLCCVSCHQFIRSMCNTMHSNNRWAICMWAASVCLLCATIKCEFNQLTLERNAHKCTHTHTGNQIDTQLLPCSTTKRIY